MSTLTPILTPPITVSISSVIFMRLQLVDSLHCPGPISLSLSTTGLCSNTITIRRPHHYHSVCPSQDTNSALICALLLTATDFFQNWPCVNCSIQNPDSLGQWTNSVTPIWKTNQRLFNQIKLQNPHSTLSKEAHPHSTTKTRPCCIQRTKKSVPLFCCADWNLFFEHIFHAEAAS